MNMWLIKLIIVNCGLLLLQYNVMAQNEVDQDDSIAEKLYFVFYHDSIDKNVSIWLPDGQNLSKQEGFDPNKTTVFFANGYVNDLNSPLGLAILDGYLAQKENYNIVQINYTYYSFQNLEVFLGIPKIGEVIGKELTTMIDTGTLQSEKIHLVGISLGGQLVGDIAKHAKVSVLIGLDPAGPGFLFLTSRIQRGYANYTIEIHSDAGVYGTPYFNGDVNYAPHDGIRFQPGCPTNVRLFSFSEAEICSHHRSPYIWSYSLQYPKLFIAVPCKYTGFCRESCDMNSPVYITPETRVYGTYYLETKGDAPYGLGVEGIRDANQKNTSVRCQSSN